MLTTSEFFFLTDNGHSRIYIGLVSIKNFRDLPFLEGNWWLPSLNSLLDM